MPRPREYQSNAERQAAYRQRMRDAGEVVRLQDVPFEQRRAMGLKTGYTPEERAVLDARNVKHGHTIGHIRTPTYQSWHMMKVRCLIPTASNYADYGGRGITICERWLGRDGFAHFLADMGERPEGTSIERNDVNGNYTLENCRWATASEQRANRRPVAA